MMVIISSSFFFLALIIIIVVYTVAPGTTMYDILPGLLMMEEIDSKLNAEEIWAVGEMCRWAAILWQSSVLINIWKKAGWTRKPAGPA